MALGPHTVHDPAMHGRDRASTAIGPDQEAVADHHRHRVAVKARPQPPLVRVPPQYPFGLLVVLTPPSGAGGRARPSGPGRRRRGNCSTGTCCLRSGPGQASARSARPDAGYRPRPPASSGWCATASGAAARQGLSDRKTRSPGASGEGHGEIDIHLHHGVLPAAFQPIQAPGPRLLPAAQGPQPRPKAGTVGWSPASPGCVRRSGS